MYIQTKSDRYKISQLVAERALDAWEKTVRPPMVGHPRPHPKEHEDDFSKVSYAIADFDRIYCGKKYLTCFKRKTIVKLLKPSGINAEGWSDGEVNETSDAGSMSESKKSTVREGTDVLLSEHELAQERLYRLWRAGWVRGDNVLLWTQSLERLSLEGSCDYLIWLLQWFPRLCKNEERATSEGSVRGAGDTSASKE